HRLAAPRNQLVPLRQRLSGGAQSIGAGLRQPVEAAEILLIELHAIGHPLHSVLIVEATSVSAIEQLASDVGRIKQPRLLVLELVDAAASAAVAQPFPLAAVQRSERLLPEWRAAVHDKSSLALLTGTDQAGKRA